MKGEFALLQDFVTSCLHYRISWDQGKCSVYKERVLMVFTKSKM